MKPKTYLSGKITGLSVEQYTENFARAAELVRAADMEPINPLEVELVNCGGPHVCGGEGEIHHWSCYMKHDIILLMNCDSITVLPNWFSSSGAKIELKLADDLGMPSYAIDQRWSTVMEWRNHERN